jgi:hypothetical protein
LLQSLLVLVLLATDLSDHELGDIGDSSNSTLYRSLHHGLGLLKSLLDAVLIGYTLGVLAHCMEDVRDHDVRTVVLQEVDERWEDGLESLFLASECEHVALNESPRQPKHIQDEDVSVLLLIVLGHLLLRAHHDILMQLHARLEDVVERIDDELLDGDEHLVLTIQVLCPLTPVLDEPTQVGHDDGVVRLSVDVDGQCDVAEGRTHFNRLGGTEDLLEHELDVEDLLQVCLPEVVAADRKVGVEL